MKTDEQLQADVIQELTWDPSITHEHIGVSVLNGIVTLSGTIPSYIEKTAAERAAQRVFGVKAVVEKIDVKLLGASKRTDQDIAQAILSHLRWNSQVPDDLIKVTVDNGWVKLRGEVEWDYQRTAAENTVKLITGVINVSNMITLKAKKVQPDQIKSKIQDALKRSAEREANSIRVEVMGTRAVLSGPVRSFAEMDDVRGAAWNAPGVTSVENNLHVVSHH